MMKLTQKFGYRFHVRVMHHITSVMIIFLVFTLVWYLYIFEVIRIPSDWFMNFLTICYAFMVIYIGKTLVPMVNMNEGLTDMIIRFNEIRYDVSRLLANKSIPFYEFTYLHENITTQMIIRYLKQMQEEENISEEWRVDKAREVLAEANEALGNAVEILENQLNYKPISILGVPMSPTLLLTLSIAVGTLIWNFVSSKLF